MVLFLVLTLVEGSTQHPRKTREREGEGRLECGGPQLGGQWRSDSDRAWAERSSGGLVPASAGG